MTTSEQLKSSETDIILEFKKEFETLCEKYALSAIVLGVRPAIKEIEDKPDSTGVACFLDMNIRNISPAQVVTFRKLSKKLDEEIREMTLKALFSSLDDDTPCDCENCKGQAKEDPATAEAKPE